MRTAVEVTSRRAGRLLPNAGNRWADRRGFSGDSHRRAAVASFRVPVLGAGSEEALGTGRRGFGVGALERDDLECVQRGQTLLGPQGSRAPVSAGRMPTGTDRPTDQGLRAPSTYPLSSCPSPATDRPTVTSPVLLQWHHVYAHGFK